MTNSPHSLSERIRQHYPRLTQSSQRVADYLQLNPEKILILSTGEIAQACDVSKTSVSRFIRQLGYDDHLALRQELMSERDKGAPVLTSSVEDPDIQHDMRALEQLWAQLTGKDSQRLIEAIATAKSVKIIGYRNSYPLAMHFRQQLMQCRGDVDLLPIPGQTLAEDLINIHQEDFVVLIGIRRRIRQFDHIVEQLQGQRTLLITDQSGQKYADRVSHVMICHMNNHAPLDSYAVPMSLISYLVNKVYRHLGQSAVQQSQRISEQYTLMHEIE